MLNRTYIKYMPWIMLGVALIVTFSFSYRYYSLVRNNRQARFNSIVNEVKSGIQDRLYDYVDGLYGGVGLFDASDYVSREEWRNYVGSTQLSKRFPGILGMGYIQVVDHQKLKLFLNEMKKQGAKNYEVKPEGIRPYYYLVKYIEPSAANEAVLGYDMNVEDMRHIALIASRNTGKPALTSRIFVDQQKEKSPGFLLFAPHYKNSKIESGQVPSTIAMREMNIRGWVFERFVAQEFFDGVLRHELLQVAPQIFLTVNSKVFRGKKDFLFSNKDVVYGPYAKKKLSRTIKIRFFGAEWLVKIDATPAFFKVTEVLDPLWIFIIGVMLSLLLFGFVYALSFTQRNAMRLANNMTIEMRGKLLDLERTNEELYHLIYIASHDLKAPLHGIHSVTEWIEEDLKDKLSPKLCENINNLKGRIKRLHTALDKLVEYSRIRSLARELKAEKVDTKKLIEGVFLELPNLNSVELTLSEADFPVLVTHHVLLQSVLEQLMTNALQYSQESNGKLQVSAVEDAGYIIFELKDNGLGMTENQITHIFELYQSIHGHHQDPSLGMGLVIAKKIVDTYGGVIKVVTNEWGGISCYFTWPVIIDSSLFD